MRLESTSARGALRLALTLALAFWAIAAPQAKAQSFNVIHTFTGGSDGANPLSGFLLVGGNLYGTATSGGGSGHGVVFKLSTAGEETVLHEFTGGSDGASPEGSLVYKAGAFYGTTTLGGASNAGTVFKITPKGVETVLYSFTGKADGANPVAGLAVDKAGNLYGTTSKGGTYGYGTVFELSPSGTGWTETILHHFELKTDGGIPYAGLVLGNGNLYGAATEGGAGGSNGGGTVFKLTHSNSGWTFSVLYGLYGWNISGSFRNLLFKSGKLYATTHCDGADSSGTVYELTESGGVWTYTPLYLFTGGSDGRYSFSNLVSDSLGNFYGTTNIGGASGNGVAFKVTP